MKKGKGGSVRDITDGAPDVCVIPTYEIPEVQREGVNLDGKRTNRTISDENVSENVGCFVNRVAGAGEEVEHEDSRRSTFA